MEILSNFGENLKELIDEKQITVEEFARSVDIAYSEVYRYLRKEYLPHLTAIIKIADTYNCSVDYLLGFVAFDENSGFKKTPDFATRFKEILRERNLTRYRIHVDTGLSLNCLDSWYNGKFTPSVDNLLRLKNYLKCSLDYTLGRE